MLLYFYFPVNRVSRGRPGLSRSNHTIYGFDSSRDVRLVLRVGNRRFYVSRGTKTRFIFLVWLSREMLYYGWVIAELTHRSSIKTYDSEVKGCGMVLIPWEIKGLYCMWFIADLTSPEELWVRVCCRGWYEGDIEDGVGGWCFTTFLTFSTFYNVWLLFYNVQCVGYAFKSNLVAFVSIVSTALDF